MTGTEITADNLYTIEDAVRELMVIVRMARAGAREADEFMEVQDCRYATKVLSRQLEDIAEIGRELEGLVAELRKPETPEPEEAPVAPKPASAGKRK